MEDKNLFILHIQHHGSWWPGSTRSQGISTHGTCIGIVIVEYSILSIRRVNVVIQTTVTNLVTGDWLISNLVIGNWLYSDTNLPLYSHRSSLWLEYISLLKQVPGGYLFLTSLSKYMYLNSLSPGKVEWNFLTCNFQTHFSDWWLRHLLWNCSNMNVSGLHWWSVSIGSGNGLVPSGNLSQCWPKSLSPSGVTRPQWVK